MFVHKYACDGGGGWSIETKRDDIGVDFFAVNGIGSSLNSPLNRLEKIASIHWKIFLIILEKNYPKNRQPAYPKSFT